MCRFSFWQSLVTFSESHLPREFIRSAKLLISFGQRATPFRSIIFLTRPSRFANRVEYRGEEAGTFFTCAVIVDTMGQNSALLVTYAIPGRTFANKNAVTKVGCAFNKGFAKL